MNKKGFIMHPWTWIIAAFIFGAALMYMIAIGIIPLNLPGLG